MYTIKIVNASANLTARDRINLKDTNNAVSLDELTKAEDKPVLHITQWAELNVSNDENGKEYNKYVLAAADGTKYTTGSANFWKSFLSIASELAEEGEDEVDIVIYRLPSKNFPGKEFITCSLA